MTPDLFLALTLGALAAYMATNALWTQEYTRLQSSGTRLVTHAAGCAIASGLGVVGLVALDPTYDFAASYLFMPMVYLTLLMSASRFTRRRYGRPLLPANKNNMQHESMTDAKFSDYAFFLIVHVVPLLAPPAIFEGILGKPV